MKPSTLLTLTEVADRIGRPNARVKYAIDVYRIPPYQRAGIIRLWREEDIPEIQSAIARVESRRRGNGL
jgi:hypothetical protein